MIASLADLILEGQRRQPHPLRLVVPLPAMFGDEPVVVTAILERTAVYHHLGDERDKQLARLDRLDVNPRLFTERSRWEPIPRSVIAAKEARARSNGGRETKVLRQIRHVHQRSAAAIEREEHQRLAISRGREWCSMARHEVEPDAMSAKAGACRECMKRHSQQQRDKRREAAGAVA